MFRNMVTSLFKHERIRTTDTKAKELQRWADNLITLAKRGDLHARRRALSIVREKDVVHKLFDEAEEKFGATAGGYTRIVGMGRRPGDAAPISMIELITAQPERKKRTRKPRKAGEAEKKSTADRRSAAVTGPAVPEKGKETAEAAPTEQAADAAVMESEQESKPEAPAEEPEKTDDTDKS